MMRDEGLALLAGGRFPEALACYTRLLRQQPASVPARLGLAQACAGSGDALAAAAWLSDAMRLAPEALAPQQALADLLLRQKQCAQALPLYLRLLGLPAGRTAANLLHAAFCHEAVGELDQAVLLYREVLAGEPQRLEAHVDLAGLLWRLEDFEGALAHARQAVQLAPQHPHARRILGTALLNLNRLDEAERQLRQALQLQPGFAPAELDLAFTLLLAGRLQEGWPWYERRWNEGQLQRPAFYQPAREWQGPAVPLAGQAIAVYGEQGWGDVLQFARYLPRLQALGAQVCGVFQPELVPLLEASFPGLHCLAPGRRLEVQSHVALMELPGRLGTTLASVPAAVPYLQPPAAARARWQQALVPWRGQRKVGLAWSGSPTQVNNRNRAMPPGLLLPLLGLPGVQGFSLQKGDAGEVGDALPPGQQLVDLTPQWQDFGDSAAMIGELDLVITVDTAIAHLAGALGKPVWILLPPNPDWRWLLEREDSPWYPTARLFRRGFGEDRSAQMQRVREALERWLA